MRAVIASGTGGPEVLSVGEAPEPTLRSGEVLVDVVATAVNRADTLQRMGFYRRCRGAPSPRPRVQRHDRRARRGRRHGWSGRRRGRALLGGGGYAEQVAVPAGQLLPLPPALTLLEAGALPEVTCTVWSNVFMIAGCSRARTSSSTAAAAASARWPSSSRPPRRRGLRHRRVGGEARRVRRPRCGHDDQLPRRGLRRAARRPAGGADVILDNMGAKYLARNVEALADSGRLVIIGMMGAPRPSWTSTPCCASAARSSPPRSARAPLRRRRPSARRSSSTSGRWSPTVRWCR